MHIREHLRTVGRHRRLVRHYCLRLGLVWQGLTHDLSKYSPTEFWRGVKYYHPLYGSLRPHETPYRTVVLSDRPQTPDEEECLIMSEAITRIDTFTPPDRAKMPQRILEDYQMIDCSLVRNTFAF